MASIYNKGERYKDEKGNQVKATKTMGRNKKQRKEQKEDTKVIGRKVAIQNGLKRKVNIL